MPDEERCGRKTWQSRFSTVLLSITHLKRGKNDVTFGGLRHIMPLVFHMLRVAVALFVCLVKGIIF